MSDIIIPESIDKTRLPYFKNVNFKSQDCTIGMPYLCTDKDGNIYRYWVDFPHAPIELYNEFHDSNGELKLSSLEEWLRTRFSKEVLADYSSGSDGSELFEIIVEENDEN